MYGAWQCASNNEPVIDAFRHTDESRGICKCSGEGAVTIDRDDGDLIAAPFVLGSHVVSL